MNRWVIYVLICIIYALICIIYAVCLSLFNRPKFDKSCVLKFETAIFQSTEMSRWVCANLLKETKS